MVTTLRFIAFSLAGASYFKFGCDHGGWYWLLVAYAALELLALYLERRSTDK
jgi:hypothetical protein